MKNKKIAGLLALVIVTLFTGLSFAAIGTYNAANYQNYGNKYNCFMFVRQVLLNERANDSSVGYFNSYTSDYLHFYSYVGGSLIAEHINKNSGTPSEAQIKAAFKKAQVGDVVQMYWKWGSRSATQHTALIADIGDDYVEFLESNNPAGQIANHYYSYGGSSSKSVWGNLQTLYSAPGNSGGFSIYRFHFGEAAPEITSVPSGGTTLIAGETYSYQCQANGNVNSWSTSGAPKEDSVWARSDFPSGLSINSSGLINGTVGHNSDGKVYYYPITYYFYVNASNSGGSSSQQSYIHVWEPPYITTSQKLPDGTVNSSYEQDFFAEGTEATMKWKMIGGSIPPGLKFTSNPDGRMAKISGKPTQSGTYTFKLQCSNYQHTPNTTTTKAFRIEVKGGNDWEDSSLRPVYGYFYSGKVGVAYSDYEACYSSEPDGLIVSGDYPEGLNFSISGKKIRLKGTPKKAGTYKFSLHPYRRDGGYWNSSVYTVKIEAGIPPLKILYTYSKGKYGLYYSDYVKVTGGSAPYTASIVNGRLPYGLSLVQSGALTYVRGYLTRNTAQTYSFTLRVKDSNGSYVDKQLSITTTQNPLYRAGAPEDDSPVKPSISSKTIPNAAVGNEWETTLEAYGTQPITWFAETALPEGFVIESDTGRISGIPTAVGKYKFKVKAENEMGSATKKLKLKVVAEKPSIETRTLPNGVLKAPYEVQLEASGSEPLKWKKIGKLPSGLKLNKKDARIEGTPTKAGTYNFSLKVKNKAGYDTVAYSLVIKETEDEKAAAETENAESSSEAMSVPDVGSSLDDEQTDVDDEDFYTELFIMSDDEKFDGVVTHSAGVSADFMIDGWVDSEGRSVKVSDVKIFVNDELVEDVVVSDDGTFTIPEEIVSGEFSVYASAQYSGQELRTSEIYVSAAETEQTADNQGSSGAGCSVGAGMTGVFFALLAFMKKAKK